MPERLQRRIQITRYRGRAVTRDDVVAELEKLSTLDLQGVHWINPQGHLIDRPEDWINHERNVLEEALEEIIERQ